MIVNCQGGHHKTDDFSFDSALTTMGNSPSKKSSSKKKQRFALDDQNNPAAQLIDTVCGPYLDDLEEEDEDEVLKGDGRRRRRSTRKARSESYSDDDDDDEDDETTLDEESASRRQRRKQQQQQRRALSKKNDEPSVATSNSYVSDEMYGETLTTMTEEEEQKQKKRTTNPHTTQRLKTPLASSFAKRCFFTKAGIGMNSQHYEGISLTGNVVLMLATAMKLKGCPTICDEDLRRVEQTYPNQFSRLPDELLLSSGWRRISKYCHFSMKPIPDGVPFFHSRERLHPTGGYYFLLASAVGMENLAEVEPMTRDTLVLLETDFPDTCDQAPEELVHSAESWTLVDRFCFFSGGPINIEEDVYYQAELDGDVIFMLAFLSPSLTPEELYKLQDPNPLSEAAVDEVESVYDLTPRDFDDLRLYHLGPCRELPSYLLQPEAWTKVLPLHFLEARDEALRRANGTNANNDYYPSDMPQFTVGSSFLARQEPGIIAARDNVGRDQRMATVMEEEPPSLKMNGGPPYYHQSDSPEDEAGAPPSDFHPNSDYYTEQHAEYMDQQQRQVDADFEREEQPTDERYYEEAQPDDEGYYGQQQQQPDDDEGYYERQPEDYYQQRSDRDGYYQRHQQEEHGGGYYQEEEPEDEGYYQEQPGRDHYYSPQQPEADTEPPHSDGGAYFEDQPMSEGGGYGEDPESEGGAYYGQQNGLYFQEDTADPGELAPGASQDDALPPRSPSVSGTEFSQSSAMKGAQALLRRNRERRIEMQQERQRQLEQPASWETPRSEVSGGTWGSEVSSGGVSGASSSWTEGSESENKSSRRQLILQMAKARMKSHQTKLTQEDTTPTDDMTNDEEKKEATDNIDLRGDLD